MSIITEKTSNAFKEGKNFKLSNSRIENRGMFTCFYLFDNLIARLDRSNWQLKLWDCGRQTQTTKDRLNWILSVLNCWYIKQEHYVWYYITRKWIQNRRTGFQEIDVNFN